MEVTVLWAQKLEQNASTQSEQYVSNSESTDGCLADLSRAMAPNGQPNWAVSGTDHWIINILTIVKIYISKQISMHGGLHY